MISSTASSTGIIDFAPPAPLVRRSRGARIASVREAQLEDFGSGLTPVTEGWFVVNVRDAEWWFSERRGARCAFESEYGDPPVEFAQFGINVTVLEPGQTVLYHGESNQEAFLVLSGECALLVEDEERRLRPWDFFHCSAVDRARLRGRGRGAVRDPDGRRTLGPGSALPGVGARGALRRERGGGDLRLEAGVRDGRAVPARAAAELGSSALGVASPARCSSTLGVASARLDQPQHVRVADLRERAVPAADRRESLEGIEDANVVRLPSEQWEARRRSDRNGDDHPTCSGRLRPAHRCDHRRARRKAVVDQQHPPVVKVDRRVLAVQTPVEKLSLGARFGDDRRQVVGEETFWCAHVDTIAGCHGSDAVLGLERVADLANCKHVERAARARATSAATSTPPRARPTTTRSWSVVSNFELLSERSARRRPVGEEGECPGAG